MINMKVLFWVVGVVIVLALIWGGVGLVVPSQAAVSDKDTESECLERVDRELSDGMLCADGCAFVDNDLVNCISDGAASEGLTVEDDGLLDNIDSRDLGEWAYACWRNDEVSNPDSARSKVLGIISSCIEDGFYNGGGGSECFVSSDCSVGEICVGGVCEFQDSPECGFDEDCLSGEVCDFGVCVDEPVVDPDPSGGFDGLELAGYGVGVGLLGLVGYVLFITFGKRKR